MNISSLQLTDTHMHVSISILNSIKTLGGLAYVSFLGGRGWMNVCPSGLLVDFIGVGRGGGL